MKSDFVPEIDYTENNKEDVKEQKQQDIKNNPEVKELLEKVEDIIKEYKAEYKNESKDKDKIKNIQEQSKKDMNNILESLIQYINTEEDFIFVLTEIYKTIMLQIYEGGVYCDLRIFFNLLLEDNTPSKFAINTEEKDKLNTEGEEKDKSKLAIKPQNKFTPITFKEKCENKLQISKVCINPFNIKILPFLDITSNSGGTPGLSDPKS